MTPTTMTRTELTISLTDAVALLDVYDLIEDLSPQERAAGERLRYLVKGALVGGHCPDCDVSVGSPHAPDCNVAVCWWTGLERAACDSGHPHADTPGGFDFGDAPDRCGQDRWTGSWPGVDDASALGYWCFSEPVDITVSPPAGGDGTRRWMQVVRRCDENDARARPDFARLRTDAQWDRDQRRWLAR